VSFLEELVASLDPGKEKCGLAVVTKGLKVQFRKVVITSHIAEELNTVLETYAPEKILVGSGTFSKKVRELIKSVHVEIPRKVVDEKHSTEQARTKYFKENPPRGLWRLIPVTLQVPPEPYDDYAAIVLAEKYFAGESPDPGDKKKEMCKKRG
jgi:RNase H-fold protein (predicted Holliday junction resolvase)